MANDLIERARAHLGRPETRTLVGELADRIATLEAEALEDARLAGQGSEREARLHGRIAELEREIERMTPKVAELEAAVYEQRTAADAFEAGWKDAAAEGERRGLERAAEVAEEHYRDRQRSWKESRVDLEGSRSLEAKDIAVGIRALLPEAPAQGNPAPASAGQAEREGA